MQVTDIDSGTSLSIQALEQSDCCKRKNASKEQTQYSERCEMTTRALSAVTEPQENSALLVFLSSPDLVSHIRLCIFREGPFLNYVIKVCWWCATIVKM